MFYNVNTVQETLSSGFRKLNLRNISQVIWIHEVKFHEKYKMKVCYFVAFKVCMAAF